MPTNPVAYEKLQNPIAPNQRTLRRPNAVVFERSLGRQGKRGEQRREVARKTYFVDICGKNGTFPQEACDANPQKALIRCFETQRLRQISGSVKLFHPTVLGHTGKSDKSSAMLKAWNSELS